MRSPKGRRSSRASLPSRARKTRIIIHLLEKGTWFISRAEAKRILGGLEKSKDVVLDFKGIDEIGQGFADEMFRVWAGQHPETSLVPTNMTDAVTFMIKRTGAKL